MIHTESGWGLGSVLSRSSGLISIPCPLNSTWVFFPSSKYGSDRSADLLREPGYHRSGEVGGQEPALFTTQEGPPRSWPFWVELPLRLVAPCLRTCTGLSNSCLVPSLLAPVTYFSGCEGLRPGCVSNSLESIFCQLTTLKTPAGSLQLPESLTSPRTG